jgi:hypothetical protein
MDKLCERLELFDGVFEVEGTVLPQGVIVLSPSNSLVFVFSHHRCQGRFIHQWESSLTFSCDRESICFSAACESERRKKTKSERDTAE